MGKGKVALALWVILLCSVSSAQDPNDPGEPDTLRFCDVKSYVYGPPFTGKLRVDLFLFNDEDLVGLEALLEWQGMIEIDSVSFVGGRAEKISAKTAVIENELQRVYVQIVGIPPGPPTLEPGAGRLFSLWGVILDTGFVIIGTSSLLRFSPVQPIDFVPHFIGLATAIKADSIKPGDVNQSGEVGLEDVFGIAYYIFRGQVINFKPAADVNSDCRITLADVIYLANYIFKSGLQPVPGCVWE